MKQITINGIEYICTPREVKEEINYPVFKRNGIGEIIRWDNETQAAFMLTEYAVDIASNYEIRVKKDLPAVPYNAERGLYDKQPIWCWDDHTTAKHLRFYDIQFNRAFGTKGARKAVPFTNIEPVTPEQLKTMPFIWDMYLKLED
jgi:hypothetical protein